MRIILILLIIGFVTSSFAQEVPTPVKAELISNIDSSNSINLGVLFDIDPGWHIYWKHPGDTGLPTKIVFNVPEGYEASETLWPIPSSFKNGDSGVDYGYKDSVLIWRNIQFPAGVTLENIPNIETNVSWISCKEICIPGKANFVVTSNTISKDSDSDDIFNSWTHNLPISFSDEKNPLNIEVQKKYSDDRVNIKLKIKSITDNKDIEFYPNPGDSLLVQNIGAKKTADNQIEEISFEVKAQNGVVISDNVLDGLIVYSDKEGRRSAVEMKINLDNN